MKHVLIFIFLLAVCLTECRPTKLPVKDQYDAEVKLPWEADSSPVEDNHHVLHPAEVQARNSRNQLAPEKRAANTTSSETLPSVSDSSHLEVTFNRTTNISTIWIIKEDGQIGATIPIVNGTIMLPLPTSSALTTTKTSGDIKSTSLTSRAAVSVNDSHAKTHIVTVTVTANTSTSVSIESLSTTSTATSNTHNDSITPSNKIKPALNQSISATLIPPVSATPIANQSLILSNLTSSQPTATKQQPVSLNSTTTPSIQFGNGTRTNSTSSYLQSTASVVPNNPNGTHSALQSHSPLNSLATVNSSFVTDTSSNTESTSRFSPFSTSTGIVEQTDLPESKTTEIIHSNSATDSDSPTDGADNEQQHHNSESSYASTTSQTESSVVPTMIPPAISASNTMDSQSNRNVILQTVSGLMFVIGLFDWIYFTTLCTICGIASSAMISASKKISKSTFDHPEQIAGNKAILVIVSFILVLLVRIAINLPYAYILIPWFTFTNKFIERVVVNYIHWIIFGLNIAVFTPFFVATFALWTRKSSYPAPTGTNPSIQILPIIPVVITLPPTFFDQTETPKISPNTLITSINAVIRSKKDCVSETIVHIFIAFNYSKEVEPGESSLENLIYEVIVKKLVSLNDYNPLKSSQNTHIELLRKMLRVEQDGGIGNIGLDSEQSLQTLSSEESRIEGEDSILIDKVRLTFVKCKFTSKRKMRA
ncbi:hypothetical protein HK098_000050 [Nowakowskiella sp. JEL0407]|nr:hypothetical protein HK098_000050 [Nowakowskiella sp. JEL0407]